MTAPTPSPGPHDPAPSPLRASLPDHASHRDDRGIPLDRVGIADLRWPIRVWDRSERYQGTVATIRATVGLPADVKGTHMSRFVEVLQEVGGELSLRTLPELLAALQRRLAAGSAQLDVAFPYFMTRRAPVSGVSSLLEYQAVFHAERAGDEFDFTLEVVVPVTTVCPCSKAISDRGAHNQRGRVRVVLRPQGMVWIEDVVEAVEACASAPLYALLKREDEKFVTERAYDHPVFVEDLAREVVAALRDRAAWLSVEVENVESIHNHAAWAHVEVGGPRGPRAGDVEAPSPAPAEAGAAPTFGAWLRAERRSRGWSQQELAARVGVSAPLFSKVESDERSLPDSAFGPLAERLGLSADWLRLRAGVVPPAMLSRIQADPARLLQLLGDA